MKFGMRRPSIRGRISARTSWKRYVRHSMGIKAPRGYGWLTNPKKAAYNRVYNRTTFSIDSLFKAPKGRWKSAAAKPKPTSPRQFTTHDPSLGGLDHPEQSLNVPWLLTLVACACAPTLVLWLYYDFSLKWSILLPIILVSAALWGEAIVHVGVGLFILYILFSVFLH